MPPFKFCYAPNTGPVGLRHSPISLSVQILEFKESAARELQGCFKILRDDVKESAVYLQIDIETMQDTLLGETDEGGLRSLDELEGRLSE